MKVKYFAWVRERVGKSEETVEPPASVRTVDDMIVWLAKRREFQRHLPGQRSQRDHRGADAGTLSRHGGGRNCAACRDRDVSLAVDRADRHSSRRSHRARRKYRSGADGITAPTGGVSGGGVFNGLSEGQRAVLEG